MDPLSAVLAFTGLSASLITLIDATIHISKKLVQLQNRLKQASSKILQLQHDLQNLRSLMEAIQARLYEQDATGHPPTLRTLCESFVEQLKKDLLELQQIVEKLATEPGPLTAKRFKAQARQVLAESTIADFHGRIATHIGYLGMVQALIYGLVTVPGCRSLPSNLASLVIRSILYVKIQLKYLIRRKRCSSWCSTRGDSLSFRVIYLGHLVCLTI